MGTTTHEYCNDFGGLSSMRTLPLCKPSQREGIHHSFKTVLAHLRHRWLILLLSLLLAQTPMIWPLNSLPLFPHLNSVDFLSPCQAQHPDQSCWNTALPVMLPCANIQVWGYCQAYQKSKWIPTADSSDHQLGVHTHQNYSWNLKGPGILDFFFKKLRVFN